MLLALDYRTGKVRWSRTGPRTGAGNGILSTAGGLVFTNESGHLVALDAGSGKVLWHVNPGGYLTGSPMSYELDGRQFVLTPVDGVLYAWALPTSAELRGGLRGGALGGRGGVSGAPSRGRARVAGVRLPRPFGFYETASSVLTAWIATFVMARDGLNGNLPTALDGGGARDRERA